MVSNTCSTSIGDSPMLGSSISITRGRAISARAIASICCSPPDSVPATCVQPLAQAREQRQHLLLVVGDAARGRGG